MNGVSGLLGKAELDVINHSVNFTSAHMMQELDATSFDQ